MDPFVEPSADDVPVVPLTPAELQPWLDGQPERVRRWVGANAFEAAGGQALPLPEGDGGVGRVLFGLGESPDLWSWAALPEALAPGSYTLYPPKEDAAEDWAGGGAGEQAALAWALAAYRFTRYKAEEGQPARLAWPAGVDRASVRRQAEAVELARDLVNTPAEHLGPEELAGALVELAARHDAHCRVLVGDALLEENYPAIHVVGRASSRAPRLADLTWGDEGAPKVTLVGKGVVFDSGGLDLKTAEGMKLMKKDMGGAATAIGLAHALMDAGLPVRLRLLVPAVENALAGNAFRPLDVIETRKGLSVEVGNTDAEGRLVLCDALAEADAEEPDALIDFATLTGAARIALGTELPALFASDETLAEELLAAGRAVQDPFWRLPLHRDYRRFLDSTVADLSNIGSVRTGGAIVAALFLSEFVSDATPWAHVDTMAWNEAARPGRPLGGEAFGLRAAYRALRGRYRGGS